MPIHLIEERQEDIQAFNDKFGEGSFDRFNRLRDRLKNAGISVDIVFHTKNTSVDSMLQILNDAENRVVKDKSGKTKLNRKLVAENAYFKVWDVLDWETSMNMGDDTSWCIAGRYNTGGKVKPSQAEYFFNDYKYGKGNGVARVECFLFVMPKKPGLEKWCICAYEGGAFEFWDKNDTKQTRNAVPQALASTLPSLEYGGVVIEAPSIEKGLLIKQLDGERWVVGFSTREKDTHYLKNVVIPDGVTGVKEEAFLKCKLIKSVAFSDSVKTIEDSAFYDCYNLTSVTIGKGVTSIGRNAFHYCPSLASLSIPDSVTDIGYGAFAWCSKLPTVAIPKSVKSISDHSFSDCRDLTSVEIENGVTSIEDAAFFNCYSLPSITIPDSVTSIGRKAFACCSGLTSINFTGTKAQWNAIDKGMFWDSLTDNYTIHCTDGDITEIHSVSEDLVLTEGTKYDKKAAKILSDSGLFNEEESQNIINDLFRNDIEAFVHAPAWLEKYLVCIANIIVKEADGDKEKAWQFIGDCPDTFNEFLKWVKEYRPKLSDPDKATFDKKFIEEASFKDIKDTIEKVQAERDAQSKAELADMEFEESNYNLVPIESYDEFHSKYGGRATGDGESDLYAGNGGTAWCHANSKSTYDSSRWAGGGKRFFVLERKDWRDIPFNPTTNKEMAGKDDYGNSLIAILVSRTGNLLAATLRCNHVGVPKDADEQYKTYAELSKIAGFNVEDAVKEYIGDVETFDSSKYFKVKDGVLYRNFDMGFDIEEITEYVIPDGVTSIGHYAFSGCANLPSIIIPDSVTSIGDCAFHNCEKLTSVKIGNGVTSIGYEAFAGCSGLTSVTIPDSVTDIGSSVFFDCSGLTSVTLGKGVPGIPTGEFAGCSGLSSIKIPDSITGIGNNAFGDCTALTSITIPDSVTHIENTAFGGCTNLRTVILGKSVNRIEDYVFYNCFSLKSITIPDSVVEIGTHAFDGCRSLQEITIPKGVSWIGHEAFKDCTGLASVTISNGVDYIGFEAFRGCSALPTITIPSSVSDIMALAFGNCTGLTSVVIKDGVTKIRDNAFYQCTKLTSVVIPNSVSQIGSGAFTECPNLTIKCEKDSYADAYANANIIPVQYTESLGSSDGRIELDESIDEEILTEGTRYDKQAAKIIADSGLYDLETSEKIIDALFHEDIHAFVHAPNWLEKYLKGIARMLVEEANGDKEMAKIFLSETPAIFNEYLTWVKENRDNAGGASFDNKFVTTLRYEDIEEFVRDLNDKRDAESKEKLANMKFGDSDYKLVPIESYEQMHERYGGKRTGDGQSDGYAGDGHGGTAWCHTNSESTYDQWTTYGQRFFVLEKNGWKYIPFDPDSNYAENGKDDYGNSLIAIRVDGRGRLVNATLRCNHVGVRVNADNQYDTYAELSELAGFNVQDAVRETMGLEELKGTVEECFYIADGELLWDYNYAEETGLRKEDLVTFKVPATAQTIGSYAFSGCDNLKKVTFEGSVTSIGEGAFRDCVSLEKIELPDGLIKIGDLAFFRCRRLKLVSLPRSLKSVGAEAFSFAGLVIADFRGSVEEWCEIHFSSADSNPSMIADELLFNGQRISDLTIPDSVQYIGNFAFVRCTGIRSLTIGKNVNIIGDLAFYECWGIRKLDIPEGVRKIGMRAFFDCSVIPSVTIPRTVGSIESFAFASCVNLKTVKFLDGNEIALGYDIFGKCEDLRIECPKDSVVSEYAQYWHIPTTYTEELSPAGDSGIALTEEREEDIASFEDKFGAGSFERFNRLKGRLKNANISVDIVFHTKNTDVDTMLRILNDADNRVVKDNDGEAKLNRKLVAENDHYTVWDVLDWETAMNMGDGTSWCIAGRYDTNEVKPSQAKKYFNEYKNERGVKAFLFFMPKGDEEKYCMVIYPHLTYQFWDSSDSSSRMNTPPVSTFNSRVPIPEIDYMGVNVQYPEERAGLIFSGTRSVIGFTDDLDLDNAVIPEGVQAIAKGAFLRSSIKKVTFPESLLEICAGAFQECDKLREIQVPRRCVFIGTFAFAECSSIERVDLPESIRAIHSGAFYGCKSLKRVAIPSSVTTIEDNTFRACSELSEVILPEGLKSIEWGAFAHCPNLSKIRLPDLLVHIDHDAFYGHNPDLTIQCHKGTLGEEFAEQHHLKVEYVD